jgi:RimJ/RimL family protein N-acetyltransferase
MINGKLTRLRPMEPEDAEKYYLWINDPEVKEYLGRRYFMSKEAEKTWLQDRTKKEQAYDNLNFAIETQDGRHIGSLGVHQTTPEERKATLGIMIGDKEFWDRGYGADALTAMLRFAFDEMNMHRVEPAVDEHKSHGIACYRKVGFVEEGRLRESRFSRGRYWDTIVMSILEDEFRARHGDPS